MKWGMTLTWDVIPMTAKKQFFFLTFWARRPPPGQREILLYHTADIFVKSFCEKNLKKIFPKIVKKVLTFPASML